MQHYFKSMGKIAKCDWTRQPPALQLEALLCCETYLLLTPRQCPALVQFPPVHGGVQLASQCSPAAEPGVCWGRGPGPGAHMGGGMEGEEQDERGVAAQNMQAGNSILVRLLRLGVTQTAAVSAQTACRTAAVSADCSSCRQQPTAHLSGRGQSQTSPNGSRWVWGGTGVSHQA